MDPKKADAIQKRIRALLAEPLASEFGLDVGRMTGSYAETSLGLKIELSEVSEDGTVLSLDAQRLTENYGLLGFEENPLGKTFMSGGKAYKLIGIRARGKRTMVATALASGKSYKFDELATRRLLGAKIEEWETA